MKISAPALLLAIAMPFAANANVQSDMANSSMSLMQVMMNATRTGTSAADATAQMVAAAPNKASAIVATAIVSNPDDFEAIINAAVGAGAEPEVVVSAALLASDGDRADQIIAATIAASPAAKRQSIIDASVRALPSTARGIAAIAASPLRATTIQTSGGGIAITAAQVTAIQSALNSIEQTLGATNPEQAAQIAANLQSDLQSSQANVAAVVASIQDYQAEIAQFQAEVRAAQQANAAAIAAFEAEVATAQAEYEAELEAYQAQLEEVTAEKEQLAAEQARAELLAEQAAAAAAAEEEDAQADIVAAAEAEGEAAEAAAEQKLAEAQASAATTASQQLDEAEAAINSASDPVAAAEAVEAEADQVLASLGTPEAIETQLNETKAQLKAQKREQTQTQLSIDKVEATIAALEAGSSAATDTGILVNVSGQSLPELFALLTTLNAAIVESRQAVQELEGTSTTLANNFGQAFVAQQRKTFAATVKGGGSTASVKAQLVSIINSAAVAAQSSIQAAVNRQQQAASTASTATTRAKVKQEQLVTAVTRTNAALQQVNELNQRLAALATPTPPAQRTVAPPQIVDVPDEIPDIVIPPGASSIQVAELPF